MQKVLSIKIGIFIVISMLGPLSLNMFLPSLPLIRDDFGSSISIVQLTISLAMTSFALGTFFNGFISDRIGRKKTIIAGLILHILGNILSALSWNVWILILGRVIMTYGGSGIAIAIRAGISDIYGPKKAASAYALLALGIVFVPMLAPSLGGYVTSAFSWRTIFVMLMCLGIVFLIISLLFAPNTETPKGKKVISSKSIVQEIKQVLKNKKWRVFAFFGGMMPTISFTFISVMPYLTKDLWNFSPSAYGNWLIVSTLGYFMGNLLSIYLNRIKEPFEVVFIGGCGVGIFSVLLLTYSLLFTITPLLVFGIMALVNMSIGIAQPTAIAQAIDLKDIPKGATTSMQGIVQTGLPIIGVQLVGFVYNGSSLPAFFIMAICGITACVLGIKGAKILKKANIKTSHKQQKVTSASE